MNKITEIEWRVIARGGAGIEFGLVGFGAGRDLFHRYIRLGVVTLYITSKPLHRFLSMMAKTHAAMRGQR